MKEVNDRSIKFRITLLSLGKIYKYLLILLVVSLFYPLQAQDLDDFRESASYSRGIEIIPFSGLRSSASTIASDVQRLKGEYSSASDLNSFSTEKKRQLGIIAGNTKKLNATKDLQSEYPGVVVDDWVRDIEEANRAIDQAKTELNTINERMKAAVNTLNRLMEARKLLYEKFKEVLTELQNAKNNPTRYLGDNPSEDDIRSLNGYIDRITDNIEDENESHKGEVSAEENAKKNLEELIGKTEYWK